MRETLSRLKTVLDISLRTIPDEFQTKGKKTLSKVNTQYNSVFYWEEKKWYRIKTKQSSRDDILDTYNLVNDFIDNIDNYIEEKKITQ